MGREDLSSKLTQISSEGPFPSLPDLRYKTTGNRQKDQETGKSLSSEQSRFEPKVYHALLLLASQDFSSSLHQAPRLAESISDWMSRNKGRRASK